MFVHKPSHSGYLIYNHPTNHANYRKQHLSSNLLHCLSKNDTHVAHYNFDADRPILISIGGDVAERVCYQMICHPTSPK